MRKIWHWTARRSGAVMTIKGTDDQGQPVSIRATDIEADHPYPIAKRDGQIVAQLATMPHELEAAA